MSNSGEHAAPQGTSRRDFMKTATALTGAAAAVALATSAAKAAPVYANAAPGKAPKPPREGETIRIGVIGVGGMGRGHCAAFRDFGAGGQAKVEVVAVADVNDLHAKAAVDLIAEKQATTVTPYRNYRDLLAREDIHGVVIGSPEHWHARHSVDALMSGKDVYCEKPMTFDLEEALWLREVVRSNSDKIFIVGTQKIILPKYREAKKAIEAGVIGKPTFSQASYCRNSPDGEWNYYELDPRWEPGVNVDWKAWLGSHRYREWDPKVYIRWRRYREFSSGIIGDLLVHELTPLMLALESVGWPTRVVASGGHYVDKAMENHDQVNINIEFEHGHTMIVAGSTCNEVGLENLIRGHKGNIYLNSRHCEIRPTRPYVEEVEQQTIECPDIGNDQHQLRLAWLEGIRTRVQPDSTVDLGTKVMIVVDLATRSLWQGGAFEFDPATLKTRRI